MSSIKDSLIAFGCVLAGGLVGLLVQGVLPPDHLAAESKSIVQLAMGLVMTMAALVLGLLVASAKSAYDAQNAGLIQISANIAMLGRALVLYGPEANETRALLRDAVRQILDEVWARNRANSARPSHLGGEIVYEKIHSLSPRNDMQRTLQARALSIAMEIGKTRWLMYEQVTASVSMPLLIVLILWLTAIFISFGLFAPLNATVLSSFCVAGLAVSGAIFLILEMYAPYTGLIKISSAPLRAALAQLDD